MSSIINKLLGKDHDDHHKKETKVETETSQKTETCNKSGGTCTKTETKCEGGTCATSTIGGEKCGQKAECASISSNNRTGGQNTESHSVQRDGVNIKSTVHTEGTSTVSMANQQKLTDLVSKLGSTHAQIDEYARNQTEKINEQIQREIDEVVGRIRREQDDLLRKANEQTAEIDNEYRARLQLMVEEIDAAKAKRIADIEASLNNQQAAILQSARNEIDELNKKAAKLKIGVLEAAEAKSAQDAREITAHADLGKAATIHQQSGTTTIKTDVVGAAETETAGSATVTTVGAKTVSEQHKVVEASASQSRK
ncbi:unnamed protein product [Adineta steineri]|uniref:Uncharacterized protein n=1 Tax=Adineta steineri TaxID=433720 RepID=A0A815TYS3_9BILA|nr:unnamed protein product [Adineta steineri]CAF1509273.1 unnamed protein product [Adineta steineri]CAF1578730.1 unnamed protein product [Adineta steineri]CAF1646841.1 unnamed protein product [Adineta steineri]